MNFAINISQAVYKKNRNYNASISFHDVPVSADGLPAMSAVSKYRRKRLLISLFLCCRAVRGGVH